METSSATPRTDSSSSMHNNSASSQTMQDSQTAQDYIVSQLRLEADARDALPYQFDTCTKPLGPLRQSVFACLTCTPPPASPHQQATPAGVCYSCSISCHGDHDLVELFTKRNFACDCGTTRFAGAATPCNLRVSAETGRKGGVTGEEARPGNRYNQNFHGKFCGCGEEYDPVTEKGTMFQCLGLGTTEDGGCGEDWWHPECLMGLSRDRQDGRASDGARATLDAVKKEDTAHMARNTEDSAEDGHHDDDPPLPAGFPSEDDFDHLICYKCINAFPWIKRYAGTPGFLPAVAVKTSVAPNNGNHAPLTPSVSSDTIESKKRKAEDKVDAQQEPKKIRHDDAAGETVTNGEADVRPKHTTLPPTHTGSVTLFLKSDFRDHLCRCSDCFPHLTCNPQLLEEEDSYEPPLSESSAPSGGRRSVNSGSLLERGEAALSSMDRVRAIEGVMAYNHVKEKVKAFLAPFAESGRAVGAEDIREYFAKLRGDAGGPASDGGLVERSETDHRREQGGY